MHSTYSAGLDVLGGVDVTPAAGQVYHDYDTVLAVQKALKTRGFNPGVLDGVYGPNTSKAVRAMQAATGIPQTGDIDSGVLVALVVRAPLTSKTRTVVDATQMAIDAANAAYTSGDVNAAANMTAAAAAAASPPPPPEVKAQVAKAVAKAAAATTPVEVQAAKVEVQAAAQQVKAAVTPWYSTEIPGVHVPLWQGLLGLLGVTAIGGGIYGLLSGGNSQTRRTMQMRAVRR